MTSDQFTSEYKLLKQIGGQGGRSYTAEHRASGRAVMVHILDDSQVGGVTGLDALLGNLPPRDKARVLDRLTVDRSLVVVTQFLQGFDNFESWLRGRSLAPASRPVTPSDLPPEQEGEFTRLFRSSGDLPPPPAGRPPAVPERAPPPAAPAGSKFTDLFRTPGESPPPTQDPGDRATIPPVRMVGLRMALPPEPGSAPPELPRLRPNFGGSPEPAVQPDVAGGPPRHGDVVIRNADAFDEPPPPPSWQGPSEFTRQLASALPPTGEFSGTAAQSQPPEESAEEKRSYVPLFVVLNLVFILATGVIVYFLLKRC
jgi:hypothetical protein